MAAERAIDLMLRQRWLVLAGIAVVTLVAGISASRVRFDQSVESWFLADDPSVAVYSEFIELFKADQIVIAAVFADDVFDPAVLGAIDRISTAAAGLDHVERVRSITRSGVVRQIGGIEGPDFRRQIVSSPLQFGSLVSENADAAAIVVYYSPAGRDFRTKRHFVRRLQDIMAVELRGIPASHAITGGPVLGEAAQARNERDLMRIMPAMVAVILIVTYLVFRQAALALLPLAAVGIAITWTYGLMGFIGWKMTMISVILIPLVLAVGVAHSVHLIGRYRLYLQRGHSRTDAVKTSWARLVKPCFFASITTAFGLLSLLVSRLEPLREFAATAAFGVVAAFLVSLSFIPVALCVLPTADRGRATFADNLVSRILAWLTAAGPRYQALILSAALVAAISCAWLATRVEVGLDPMSWIRHGDPIRVDTERIDGAFAGGLTLEFLLSSPDGRLAMPASLRKMQELEEWLAANTTVTRATSIADLVRESARIARGGETAGYELPRSKFLTDSLLDALRREDELAPWITSDYKRARVSARIPLGSAQDIVAEIPAIRESLATMFAGTGIDVQMTGHAVLSGLMQVDLIDSQKRSFAVAFVVVSLLMILLLRSIPLGLLAMIPNLLPIVIGLAAMTLFDIALNPGTVMIAAVALGIVVDDTVHILTAFEREMDRGRGVHDAIALTVAEVGRPVFVTSLLLAAGFAVLLLGEFLPSGQIGGLVALIVAAAFVTDLLLLPALLRLLPVRAVAKFLRA